MPQVRRKLRQRLQDEPSFRHARMRNLQLGRLHHRVPIEQNIEIDHPRALWAIRLIRPMARSIFCVRPSNCRGNRSVSTSTT